MGIKTDQHPLCRIGRHNRRRRRNRWGRREWGTESNSKNGVRVPSINIGVSYLSAGQIVKDSKSPADHSFPTSSLTELVCHADARRKVSVPGVVDWSPRRGQSQLRKIRVTETRHCRHGGAILSRRCKVYVPP